MRTQSIYNHFSTNNRSGGQSCSVDQVPLVTVTLVFYCIGKKNNLNWAKILYMNTIKLISSDKTRKQCLHRITLCVSRNQGKVFPPGESSGRLHQA